MGYNAGWGLMILRIAVGIVFLMHGGQKLFVYGFGGVGASFAKMGIPMPEVMAVVVTLVEFLGGLALVLGLFTRWAALLLAINMLVAMFKVHFRAGFFLPQGYEFTFVLAAANIALALAGPGNLALERMLWRRR
jgi:putative oxidoreductase